MNEHEIATLKLNSKLRALAEGKLKCRCGNANWLNFLYVAETTAGCKKCGTIHRYELGKWIEIIPGPGVKNA